MDIEYKGGNCVVLGAKKVTIVVDPKISDLGLKDQYGKANAIVATQPEFVDAAKAAEGVLVVDGPGEYEVENLSIRGIAALSHVDAKGSQLNSTMYSVSAGDIRVAVVGHINPEITEDQLEALGVVDVLIVPVGGNGYTLDATGAVQIVKLVDPKVVVPTHYNDEGVKYPMPQQELEKFAKELGAPVEETAKLKLKEGVLPESIVVYKITRTS